MASRASERTSARRRIQAVALFAAAVLLALALASWSGADSVPWLRAGAGSGNWLGPVGAFVSEVLYRLIGVTALALPPILFVAARRRLRKPARIAEDDPTWLRTAVVGSLFATGMGLLGLLQAALHPAPGEGFPWGGQAGLLLAGALSAAMKPLGAGLVLVTFALIAVGARWGWGVDAAREGDARRGIFARWAGALRGALRSRAAKRARKEKARRFVARIHRRRRPADASAPVPTGPTGPIWEEEPAPAPEPDAEDEVGAPGPSPPSPDASELPFDAPPPRRGGGGERPASWKLPSLGLLARRGHQPGPPKSVLEERRSRLEAACAEHGVRGEVVRIQPGPVVTTFEYRLGEGETLKKLKTRHEEICMALRAAAIRVERIRGKDVVGIEVPNESPSVVGLREILEDPAFQQDGGALPVAIGRLVDGSPLVKDLAEMPHLLIAGATGAGKSVQINTLLCSLLARRTPDELRLVLIDPKRVELRPYRSVPHLLTPVILEPEKAKTVLNQACRELDRRTRLLEEHGVRNISGYNRYVESLRETGRRKRRKDDEGAPTLLPRLVIVVDELADLFIHARAEVTPAIQRLLSLGRAEGIHLVLATQRPSTDIISGTLKANLPTRIAFRVASYVDSRTILDRIGAEMLLGKGDMLMMRAGADMPRAQGALVTEKEVAKLARFWANAAAPVFDEGMLVEEPADEGVSGRRSGRKSGGMSGNGDGPPGARAPGAEDAMLPQARDFFAREQRASTSMLQTEFGLGYQRARRIVDRLEKEGFLGPGKGARPREVLAQPESRAEA